MGATIMHYISCGSTYLLLWLVLYSSQMYFYNEVAKTSNWLPARIVAGIVAGLIIWRYCTITSSWK